MRLFRREEVGASVDLLVAGLGNPGPEHAGDRHNVGWRVVDELARRVLENPDDQRRYLGLDRQAERASFIGQRLGEVLAPTGTPSAEA